MSLYDQKYRKESIRLKGWDYRNTAAYFVTICTKNREHYFGEIEDGILTLSQAGNIAYQNWLAIPEHFNHVLLGEFVVMPNHLHGILILNLMPLNYLVNSTQSDVQTQTDSASMSNSNHFSSISPKPGSLGVIIRNYKAVCTRQINQIDMPLYFAWQSRYYDHIIRDLTSFARIENYIINNPLHWKDDKCFGK